MIFYLFLFTINFAVCAKFGHMEPMPDLCDQQNAWLVIPDKLTYEFEQVMKKSVEYNWPREKTLLFLILQKLHCVSFNNGTNKLYSPYEFNVNANLKRFELDFKEAIAALKRISENAYENNIWQYDDNPAYEVVCNIEKKINEYVSSYEMRKLFREHKVNENPVTGSDQTFSILSIGYQKDWETLEFGLLANSSDEDVKNLRDCLDYDFYYNELAASKNLLFVLWSEYRDHLPKLSIYDIISHNWSKYLFEPSLGYKERFSKSYGKNFKLLLDWERFAKIPLKKFFDNVFKLSRKIHSKAEMHHWEYFVEEGIENNSEGNLGKLIMSEKGIQAAYLGLCARELAILMNNDQDGVKKFKYLAIRTKLLKYFPVAEIEKLTDLICEILVLYCDDFYFKRKTRYRYEDLLCTMRKKAINN